MMARSDLLLHLVRAGSQGDQTLFKKTVEALIAEERAKQHHILADNLERQLQRSGQPAVNGAALGNGRAIDLVYEITPRRSLDSLILPNLSTSICREFVEEHHRRDLLRSYGLEPRNRILLIGPPGNGKTSLAEALAFELMVPMYAVRYDGIIGAYLGETSQRLRRVFDFVSTRQCVLFFDEFDTLGKERGDTHETGEIKRVVSSLLLQVDAVPSHVVIITATNHSELLDRAVWRRFQVRLNLPQPTSEQIVEWCNRFFSQFEPPPSIDHQTVLKHLKGLSFAEIEEFGASVRRKYVLSLPSPNLKAIVTSCLRQIGTQSIAS